MAKILVGTNVLTSVDTLVYGNHIELFYHIARRTGHEIIHFAPRRTSIDRMRNMAASMALDYGCDYLMFIDDDILVNKRTLESLIEADKDIVMAITFVRSYPYNPMFFKWREPGKITALDFYYHWKNQVDEKGLIKCDAVGFSCVLIKVPLLRRVSTPYFVTGPHHTEDVYFCVKCHRELEEPPSIYVDTRVPTSHLMEPELASMHTVEFLREYVEKLRAKDQAQNPDRGVEYNDQAHKLFEPKVTVVGFSDVRIDPRIELDNREKIILEEVPHVRTNG